MHEYSKRTTKKIISALDLPEDLFLGMSDIALKGNREIYISNHRGILTYGQDEMVILLYDLQIQIKGKALSICNYTQDDLTISGYIQSMVFL